MEEEPTNHTNCTGGAWRAGTREDMNRQTQMMESGTGKKPNKMDHGFRRQCHEQEWYDVKGMAGPNGKIARGEMKSTTKETLRSEVTE